ncbi:MAG: UvrD-helicase domain-containing protein, partial [Psychrobacter sp.]
MDQTNSMGNDLNNDLSNVDHDDNRDLFDGRPNNETTEEPPAIRIKLNGKYLIEASAGTGKTWTLTGIVLRLLIEAKRAPEHIIATTFTRAAAAEMRQRIHDRLVDFYQLLQWLNNVQANPETHHILYPQLTVTHTKNDTRAANAE